MAKRIALVINHFRTKIAAAQCAGVEVNTLARWSDNRHEPNPSLVNIANLMLSAGMSLDWLVTGEGDCYLPGRHPKMGYSELREASPYYLSDSYHTSGYALHSMGEHTAPHDTPRTESRDSASLFGKTPANHELIPLEVSLDGIRSTTYFPITRHELQAHALTREGVKAFCLSDNAMAPGLSAGAIVLVDTNALQPAGTALFLVEFHGAQLVRRLQRTVSGLTLICDTPLLKDVHVPEDALDQLTVIGKIVWSSCWH
ncbi:hypothetical protein LMG33818_001696 [Halomonadaceae bacterium LMG 33818]|uniref:S24 family peptidase n=1 Tax=Cernens ardua TaxID=3402176 RepID=UPI003EDBCFA2